MAPLLRRTWWPQGKTPVIYQRTQSHKKASVIGALGVDPMRQKVSLFFRIHADANINSQLVVAFLGQLLRHLDGPLFIIWDRFLAHRSHKVQRFFNKHKRLQMYLLPAYAPELNPVENVWSYLKKNPLSNWAPMDLEELAKTAGGCSRSLQRKPALLKSLLKHSPLFLRIK
jgi:transposase